MLTITHTFLCLLSNSGLVVLCKMFSSQKGLFIRKICLQVWIVFGLHMWFSITGNFYFESSIKIFNCINLLWYNTARTETIIKSVPITPRNGLTWFYLIFAICWAPHVRARMAYGHFYSGNQVQDHSPPMPSGSKNDLSLNGTRR